MKIRVKAHIEPEITFTVTESEARAMEALAGYGTDPFLEVFYKHMGKAYLQPHESGLRSLFEILRQKTNIELNKISEAKAIFNHHDTTY